MLFPKKVKHRKWHKSAGTSGSLASRLNKISFGSFALKAMSNAWITARQIEAARRVMVRYIRKGGKIWVRIFPDKPVTIKGSETPMGKGKGAVDHYVCNITPGTILIEIDGIPEAQAKEALKMAGYKFAVKTKVTKK